MSTRVRFAQLVPWLLAVSVLANVAFLTGYVCRTGCNWTAQQTPEPVATPDVPAEAAAPANPDRFVAELGKFTSLSTQEAQRIADSRVQLMKTLEPIKVEMKEMKQRLVDLMTVDAPDLAGLRRVTQNITDAQLLIQDKTVDHLVEIRNGLNGEQRSAFDRMLKNRMCPNPMCTGSCVGSCPGCAAGNHGKKGQHSSGCTCGGGGVPFVPEAPSGGCPHQSGGVNLDSPESGASCGAHNP